MLTLVESAGCRSAWWTSLGQARLYTQYSYDYQAWLQDGLSTIESGLATNDTVEVKAGDMVYNVAGEPVEPGRRHQGH